MEDIRISCDCLMIVYDTVLDFDYIRSNIYIKLDRKNKSNEDKFLYWYHNERTYILIKFKNRFYFKRSIFNVVINTVLIKTCIRIINCLNYEKALSFMNNFENVTDLNYNNYMENWLDESSNNLSTVTNSTYIHKK